MTKKSAKKNLTDAEKSDIAYEKLASKIIATVTELNSLLREGYDNERMSVHFGTITKPGELPMQFRADVFKRTHGMYPMEWKIVGTKKYTFEYSQK